MVVHGIKESFKLDKDKWDFQKNSNADRMISRRKNGQKWWFPTVCVSFWHLGRTIHLKKYPEPSITSEYLRENNQRHFLGFSFSLKVVPTLLSCSNKVHVLQKTSRLPSLQCQEVSDQGKDWGVFIMDMSLISHTKVGKVAFSHEDSSCFLVVMT